MTHGYRVAVLWCVGLLIGSAVVIAATVRTRKLTELRLRS
jgi:hypothetical protein